MASDAVLGAVLNLLFIGNSLTASNDLPALIEAMGRASGIAVHCTVIAKPNFSLEDHWADGEARRAIARGGWSHVILQQGPSALPESRVLLNEYARRFDGDIRDVKARTALFSVWPSAARRGDFDGVSASYAGAARLTGGLLLPAGEAWRAAWHRDPALALYGADGFHPSPLGSYLAALTIFHALTGDPSARPPPRRSDISAPTVRDAARRRPRPADSAHRRFGSGHFHREPQCAFADFPPTSCGLPSGSLLVECLQ